MGRQQQTSHMNPDPRRSDAGDLVTNLERGAVWGIRVLGK
jgi:hypothetical protein